MRDRGRAGAARCGAAGSCVRFLIGGGAYRVWAPRAGWQLAFGRRLVRGWPSRSLGPPPGLSLIYGPCGILAARGSGCPRARRVGLRWRDQGGLVAWCLGVLVHPLVGPGGAGSAASCRGAACQVRGVCWPVCRGVTGVLRTRSGAGGWVVAVCGSDLSSPWW